MNHSIAHSILDIRTGPSLDQDLKGLVSVIEKGYMGGGVNIGIGQIRIGPSVKQTINPNQITMGSHIHQGGIALGINGINFCTVIGGFQHGENIIILGGLEHFFCR